MRGLTQEARQQCYYRRVFRPPSDSTAPDRTDDVRTRFLRGVRLGMPIFLGYAPVGMAFGILARRMGFSVTETIVCSGTALAGAGQFIALSLMGTGATAAATILATAVVNMRYLLFSTTLAPHVRGVRPAPLGWLAFTLTDETFAVNIADVRKGTATTASMAGVGLIAWCGWVLGSGLGAVGSAWIGDPSSWGVDFAMPAMFSALFVALAEDRRHVAIGLLAAALVLALPALAALGIRLDASWLIVIAAMAASTIAAVIFRAQ